MVHGGRPHRGIRAVLAGSVELIAIGKALVRYHRGLQVANGGKVAETKDLGEAKALLNLRHQR